MSKVKIEPSVITREFDAPRQLVFDAWTQVKHLSQWMFPMQGCSCDFVSADIKNGGKSLHKITMPNGFEMYLLTKYEEVNSPEKLIFLQYMANEKGDIVENTQIPNWPKDMLATLLFEEVSENKTKLTFLWEPRNPTEEEATAFESTRSDHGKGWGAGMEQLHIYLSSL